MTIYTRDQAMAAINTAFKTTAALKFTRQEHLDNLDVEVYHHLPHGVGLSGTLAAFIDGYATASELRLQDLNLDFVFKANGVLYNGVDESGRQRPHSCLIPAEHRKDTQVAFLWRGTTDHWTEWQLLSDLPGGVA